MPLLMSSEDRIQFLCCWAPVAEADKVAHPRRGLSRRDWISLWRVSMEVSDWAFPFAFVALPGLAAQWVVTWGWAGKTVCPLRTRCLPWRAAGESERLFLRRLFFVCSISMQALVNNWNTLPSDHSPKPSGSEHGGESRAEGKKRQTGCKREVPGAPATEPRSGSCS